jgi:hypothetical protein
MEGGRKKVKNRCSLKQSGKADRVQMWWERTPPGIGRLILLLAQPVILNRRVKVGG